MEELTIKYKGLLQKLSQLLQRYENLNWTVITINAEILMNFNFTIWIFLLAFVKEI